MEGHTAKRATATAGILEDVSEAQQYVLDLQVLFYSLKQLSRRDKADTDCPTADHCSPKEEVRQGINSAGHETVAQSIAEGHDAAAGDCSSPHQTTTSGLRQLVTSLEAQLSEERAARVQLQEQHGKVAAMLRKTYGQIVDDYMLATEQLHARTRQLEKALEDLAAVRGQQPGVLEEQGDLPASFAARKLATERQDSGGGGGVEVHGVVRISSSRKHPHQHQAAGAHTASDPAAGMPLCAQPGSARASAAMHHGNEHMQPGDTCASSRQGSTSPTAAAPVLHTATQVWQLEDDEPQHVAAAPAQPTTTAEPWLDWAKMHQQAAESAVPSPPARGPHPSAAGYATVPDERAVRAGTQLAHQPPSPPPAGCLDNLLRSPDPTPVRQRPAAHNSSPSPGSLYQYFHTGGNPQSGESPMTHYGSADGLGDGFSEISSPPSNYPPSAASPYSQASPFSVPFSLASANVRAGVETPTQRQPDRTPGIYVAAMPEAQRAARMLARIHAAGLGSRAAAAQMAAPAQAVDAQPAEAPTPQPARQQATQPWRRPSTAEAHTPSPASTPASRSVLRSQLHRTNGSPERPPLQRSRSTPPSAGSSRGRKRNASSGSSEESQAPRAASRSRFRSANGMAPTPPSVSATLRGRAPRPAGRLSAASMLHAGQPASAGGAAPSLQQQSRDRSSGGGSAAATQPPAAAAPAPAAAAHDSRALTYQELLAWLDSVRPAQGRQEEGRGAGGEGGCAHDSSASGSGGGASPLSGLSALLRSERNVTDAGHGTSSGRSAGDADDWHSDTAGSVSSRSVTQQEAVGASAGHGLAAATASHTASAAAAGSGPATASHRASSAAAARPMAAGQQPLHKAEWRTAASTAASNTHDGAGLLDQTSPSKLARRGAPLFSSPLATSSKTAGRGSGHPAPVEPQAPAQQRSAAYGAATRTHAAAPRSTGGAPVAGAGRDVAAGAHSKPWSADLDSQSDALFAKIKAQLASMQSSFSNSGLGGSARSSAGGAAAPQPHADDEVEAAGGPQQAAARVGIRAAGSAGSKAAAGSKERLDAYMHELAASERQCEEAAAELSRRLSRISQRRGEGRA